LSESSPERSSLRSPLDLPAALPRPATFGSCRFTVVTVFFVCPEECERARPELHGINHRNEKGIGEDCDEVDAVWDESSLESTSLLPSSLPTVPPMIGLGPALLVGESKGAGGGRSLGGGGAEDIPVRLSDEEEARRVDLESMWKIGLLGEAE